MARLQGSHAFSGAARSVRTVRRPNSSSISAAAPENRMPRHHSTVMLWKPILERGLPKPYSTLYSRISSA